MYKINPSTHPYIKHSNGSLRVNTERSRSINRPRDYGLVLLAFFLQVNFTGFLSIFGAKPNFLIIIAVFFALFTNERFGLEAAFLCGILLDIFSLRLFGLNTILFSFTGYIIGRSSGKIYKESMVTHAILVFLASFFILSLYRFFLAIENRLLLSDLTIGFIFSSSLFLSALYNSFLAVLIYTVLCRVLDLGETTIL